MPKLHWRDARYATFKRDQLHASQHSIERSRCHSPFNRPADVDNTYWLNVQSRKARRLSYHAPTALTPCSKCLFYDAAQRVGKKPEAAKGTTAAAAAHTEATAAAEETPTAQADAIAAASLD